LFIQKLDGKAESLSTFRVMILQNHSNALICCSRNINLIIYVENS